MMILICIFGMTATNPGEARTMNIPKKMRAYVEQTQSASNSKALRLQLCESAFEEKPSVAYIEVRKKKGE